VQYLFVVLLAMNLFTSTLFAVDARLKIEKDVEQRVRIALVDGSTDQSSKVFNIFLSDLKISGHFLADTVHHQGDVSSNCFLLHLKVKSMYCATVSISNLVLS